MKNFGVEEVGRGGGWRGVVCVYECVCERCVCGSSKGVKRVVVTKKKSNLPDANTNAHGGPKACVHGLERKGKKKQTDSRLKPKRDGSVRVREQVQKIAPVEEHN